MANVPVLELREVRKQYGVHAPTHALRGVDLRVDRGEMLALMGPSGSGKSTLLNMVGLLDTPTTGSVRVLERETTTLDDRERTSLRGRTIGFVFQFHHLLLDFTALENVMMPLAVDRGLWRPSMRPRARELLVQVGLGDKLDQSARTLSGGQQQRVAVARALVHRPAVLLADEPTGNLDTRSADDVFELLRQANREGTTVIVVTHDPRIAARCDRTVFVVDGLARPTLE
jgi:lipoprotein-releasing system ATP-binding protein